MSTEQHTDDSVRRALARLGSADPSPWMPHKEKEHPKQIAGTVVRVGLYTTSSAAYGVQTAPEVVLETPEKTWGLRAFHSVLRSQLAQNNVQPGDTIAVEYQGMRESASGGSSYHGYRVARADDAGAERVDWNRLVPPTDDGPVGPADPVIYADAAAGDPGPDPTVPTPAEQDIPF